MGRVTMPQLGRKQSYCKNRWRTNGSTTNISEWWLRNVEGTAPSTSKYRRLENPKVSKVGTGKYARQPLVYPWRTQNRMELLYYLLTLSTIVWLRVHRSL